MRDDAKAFVLLSGGIDSAVCLHHAVQHYDDVAAIHYDYGQQTEPIEGRNAQHQAADTDVPLYTLDYRGVFANFAEGTIEDKTYDRARTVDDGHSVGYVPQRNLHLLVTAAAVAEHHTTAGRSIVLYHGAQAGDAADYPDCRPAFIDAAERAIAASTDQHEITVKTPLLDRSKAGVIALGQELGVNWERTFSCYNDWNGQPCGQCPACLERREAFEQAGIDDPINS